MTTHDDDTSAARDLEAQVHAITSQLDQMKRSLGVSYWENDEVRQLQQEFRRCLGAYGGLADGGAGAHGRARKAASYESTYARLLWPGRGDN